MSYCRWAPSLGKLEGTAEQAWGTKPYVWWKHRREPTCFFGLYDLRDYLALAAHRGKAWVLWAGSDIRNLNDGFLFNDGKLKLLSILLKSKFTHWTKFVLSKAEHWVENDWEKETLESLGIPVSGVCPSFLGRIEKYEVSFKSQARAAAYISAGEGRGQEYGFDLTCRAAVRLPWMDFFLYGDHWESSLPNVFCRGRVSKEIFDKETSTMQIALSLNDFCGFSEVVARGILRGHYAVSKVLHPLIPTFQDEMELIASLNRLRKMILPNIEAREWYLSETNKFPWCYVNQKM